MGIGDEAPRIVPAQEPLARLGLALTSRQRTLDPQLERVRVALCTRALAVLVVRWVALDVHAPLFGVVGVDKTPRMQVASTKLALALRARAGIASACRRGDLRWLRQTSRPVQILRGGGVVGKGEGGGCVGVCIQVYRQT